MATAEKNIAALLARPEPDWVKIDNFIKNAINSGKDALWRQAYAAAQLEADRKYIQIVGRFEQKWIDSVQVIEGTKSVLPVFFFPKDYEAPLSLHNDMRKINNETLVEKVWFQSELGITFSVQSPRVFFGTKTILEYENDLGEQVGQVSTELLNGISNVPAGTVYAVFLYGKTSGDLGWDIGNYNGGILIMSDQARVGLLLDDSISKNRARGLFAHELAHAIGGLEDRKDGLSMMDNLGRKMEDGRLDWIYFSFPEIHFTAEEKATLKEALKSDR